MPYLFTPETLTERFTDWHAQFSIDRPGRLIRNVALAGRVSRNGYSYSSTALRDAVPLYENKPVFLDHPRERRQSHDRSTRDLAGAIVNARFEGDRVRGDVKLLDTESGRTLLALAEADAPGVGMSHVVLAERTADGKTVERIVEVISVDAVVQPATTTTFRESVESPVPAGALQPADLSQSALAELQVLIQPLLDADQLQQQRLEALEKQIEELRQRLDVQQLVNEALTPRGTELGELRKRLEQLPDEQSRRRALHAQLHQLQEHLPFVRSRERACASTAAASSAADALFLQVLKRR